jgi:hypothetical protein
MSSNEFFTVRYLFAAQKERKKHKKDEDDTEATGSRSYESSSINFVELPHYSDENTVDFERSKSDGAPCEGYDEDYSYLLSILPHTRRIPFNKKLEFRMKVDALLLEYAK